MTHPKRRSQPLNPRPGVRRGATMIEVLVATLVLGLLASASLQAVSLARTRALVAERQAAGAMLASDLMDEILAFPLVDPDSGRMNGPEGDEGGATRVKFDSVGDYAGWRSTPESRDGSAIPGYSRWSRWVAVKVDESGHLRDVVGDANAGREITVGVDFDGRTMATLAVVRTLAGDAAREVRP